MGTTAEVSGIKWHSLFRNGRSMEGKRRNRKAMNDLLAPPLEKQKSTNKVLMTNQALLVARSKTIHVNALIVSGAQMYMSNTSQECCQLKYNYFHSKHGTKTSTQSAFFSFLFLQSAFNPQRFGTWKDDTKEMFCIINYFFQSGNCSFTQFSKCHLI